MLNFYFKSTFSMKPGKFQIYFINNCRITNTSNEEIIWQHKKINRQNKKWKKCGESWSIRSILFEWNLVDNQYQQKSEVLYSFTSNKSYAYLLNVI